MQTVTYADWLRSKMDERGYSTRAMARQWRPDDFESARRMVRRYLNGQLPNQRNREEIAAALGSDDLGPDSDDSEGD